MTLKQRVLTVISGAAMVFLAVYANEAAFCEMLGFPAETRFLLAAAGVCALVAAAVLSAPKPLALVFIPAVLAGILFVIFNESLGYDILRAYNCVCRSPLMLRVLSPANLTGMAEDSLVWEGRWVPLLLCFIWGILLLLHLADGRSVFWYTAFDVLFFCAAAVFMNMLPSTRTTVLFATAHVVLSLAAPLMARDKPTAGAAALLLLLPALGFSFGCWTLLSVYERPAFTDKIVEESISLWKERGKSRKSADGGAGTENGSERVSWEKRETVFGAFPWNSSASVIRFDAIGPREPMDTVVMEIYSDRPRTIYLRGVSYGEYSPETWSQFSETTFAAYGGIFTPYLFTTDSDPREEIRLRTAAPTDVLWLPYTPTELPPRGAAVYDSYVAATAAQFQSYSYNVLLDPNAAFAPVSWAYRNFVFSEYLTVPGETREALAGITEQFDPDDPNLVFRVADYVRNCAEYDADTPAVPRGRDFVPWFLLESDRGYCVHFASAAAVLLRCLGVPARYVTGYAVDAEGSAWTPVTDDEAHAWVEYFDDSLTSWRMLEVTASRDAPGEEEEEETTAPAAPLPNLYEEPENRPEPERERTAPKPAETPKKKGPSLWLLIPIGAALFIVLWPVCRAAKRHADMKKADPNRKAILTYRRIRSYAAASRSPLSAEDAEAADEIAGKARFSQHVVTPAESGKLEALLRGATAALRRDRNLPRRLWNRWRKGV